MRYGVRELPQVANAGTPFAMHAAGVAQLVERDPSKVDVAGSRPVSRSNIHARSLAAPRFGRGKAAPLTTPSDSRAAKGRAIDVAGARQPSHD